MSTIGDLRKSLRKQHIQVGIMILLISLLSFGLGYVFGRDFNKAPIIIEQIDI